MTKKWKVKWRGMFNTCTNGYRQFAWWRLFPHFGTGEVVREGYSCVGRVFTWGPWEIKEE